MLALLATALLLPARAAEPAYRFRQPPRHGLVQPSLDLLSPPEREFLARLPVLRVGLNLPDNRPYEVIDASGEISGIQVAMSRRARPTWPTR